MGFDIRLKEAIDDPGTVLISTGIYHQDDKKIIERLRKEQQKVYEQYTNCSVVTKATKADYASGKVLKGFILTGNTRGQTVAVTLGKAKNESGKATAKENLKEGTASPEDIKAEIARLQDREKRNRELDAMKVHKAVIDTLKDQPVISPTKPCSIPFQDIDRGIMVFILLHENGLIYDTIKGIPELPDRNKEKYDKSYFLNLSKISDDVLARLIRVIAYDKYGRRPDSFDLDVEDNILFIIAQYAGLEPEKLIAYQGEIANKRVERTKEREKKLKSQLKPVPGPAKKSPVKKAKKK